MFYRLNSKENVLTPKLLGYLELIPFLASSLLIWTNQAHQYAVQSLTIYAAVILTFIGGVHWGIAVQQSMNINSNRFRYQFIYSVIPSLLAWVAIVFFNSSTLIILGFCFIVFWWLEKTHYQEHLPSWYLQLRNHLTLVASLCIVFGWLGTL